MRFSRGEASSSAHTTTLLVYTPSFAVGDTSVVRMMGGIAWFTSCFGKTQRM